MAKAAIPVQVLAIVGGATLLAGAHSLFVPIKLTREKAGFVIPDAPPENGAAGESAAGATGAQPDIPADGEPAREGAQESVSEPARTPTPTPEPADTGSGVQPAADGKISLEQAASLHDRSLAGQGVWFLDARRRAEYDAGHIQGALFMEHSHVSGGEGLDEIMMFSPPEMGELLVIYCTGGDCQASEDTAILLEAAGYSNIAIMAAGFDEWAAAGLPTEGP